MAETTFKLKPWETFSAAMEEFMKQFDEFLRENILVALYSYAGHGIWLENIRAPEKGRVPLLRRERISANSNRKQIEKIIESLNEIHISYEFDSAANSYLFQAASLLKRAAADLRITEDLLAVAIHPKFRKKSEKTTKVQSPDADQWSLYSGFGIAEIEYRVIERMADYLKCLATLKGRRLPSAEIDRIISAALNAAYSGGHTDEQVKTARSRIEKKRRSALKKEQLESTER